MASLPRFLNNSRARSRGGNRLARNRRVRAPAHQRRLVMEKLEIRQVLASVFGTEFEINSTSEGDQLLPAVAMHNDGDFVAVWSSVGQDGDGHGLFGQRFAANGDPTGDEFQINSTSDNDQVFPDVAADHLGNFVVVWESVGQDGDRSGIFGRRFDADGQPLAGEFPVNTTVAGGQFVPAVDVDAAGNFVVLWDSFGQDGDGRGIFGQRFAADGSRLDSEFQINSTSQGGQFFPDVGMSADGSFVAVWESQNQDGDGLGIVGRQFTSSGVPLGEEFVVNSMSDGDQKFPSVAVADGGAFVVVWDTAVPGGHAVRRRQFGADGTPLDNELPVDGTAAAEETVPQVASNANGEFVVTWDTVGQDGDGRGSFGQLYSAGGKAQGVNFQINTTTDDDQQFPVVAFGTENDFVVAWESFGQDSDGNGIFGQRFRFNRSAEVDLNGPGLPGTNFDTFFIKESPPKHIVAPDMTITDVDSTEIVSATATLDPLPDGSAEQLTVDSSGTSITAAYHPGSGQLILSGPDTVENFQQVLRTLSYSNTLAIPTAGSRNVEVVVTDELAASETAMSTIDVIVAVNSISGFVYADVNNDGIKSGAELPLPNVPITLDGPVTATVMTGVDGSYRFGDLPPGTYSVTETQPGAFIDGIDTAGTPQPGQQPNDGFVDLQLSGGMQLEGNNFGEMGLRADLVTKQLFLASTPSAQEMLAQLDLMDGGGWFTFAAPRDALLTTTIVGGVTDPVIEIYGSDMLPVALSQGREQIAVPVAEGETYVLHIAGRGYAADAAAVQLRVHDDPNGVPADVPVLTNPVTSRDVNDDGRVTPLDALVVINNLNAVRSGHASSMAEQTHYIDVNGDGALTPIDALFVINHLNRQSAAEGESFGAFVPDEWGMIPAVDGRSAAVDGHRAVESTSDERSEGTARVPPGPAESLPPEGHPLELRTSARHRYFARVESHRRSQVVDLEAMLARLAADVALGAGRDR